MTGRKAAWRYGTSVSGLLAVALFLSLSGFPAPAQGQSQLPGDRLHVSISLGGYFMLGVGYTHWIEEHHALIQPRDGFPVGIRVGHAWIPSNEIWRAKLGGNATLLLEPARKGWDRLVPILAFTPGLQYEPDSDWCFRADVWMSYFPTQGVFAPTSIELLSGFKK